MVVDLMAALEDSLNRELLQTYASYGAPIATVHAHMAADTWGWDFPPRRMPACVREGSFTNLSTAR